MHTASLVLYVLAAACFALEALGVNSRLDLMPLGFLAWVLVPLIHTA